MNTSPPIKVFVSPSNLTLASQEDLRNHNECNDLNHKWSDDKNICHVECPKHKIYFNDGKRSVDFVLVWDSFQEEAKSELAHKRRRIFEENLMKEGLELEYEQPESNGLNFIKIHATKEVLRRYAEILKLRMPMREVRDFIYFIFSLIFF